MAISYVGAQEAGSTLTGTMTVPTPSGIVQYDLLLAFICNTAGPSAPAGWTLVPNTRNIFYLVCGATPPTSASFGNGPAHWSGVIVAYRGVDPSSPIDLASTTGTSSAITSSPPLYTTVTDDAIVYAFAADTNNTVPSYTGYTVQPTLRVSYGGANICPIVVVDIMPFPSGNTYTVEWSSSATTGYASTVALRVAPSAPAACTLTAPANSAYVDGTSGVVVSAVYNSTDGATCNAYSARVKVSGGSYNYYNASTSSLQSTQVWNPVTVAVGGTITVTLPVTNGSAYNWSIAAQESLANEQGVFATDFTFTAQAPPTLTATAPVSTAVSSSPITEWTATPSSGASLTAWEVIWESGSYGTTPGSGTQAATASGSGNPQQAVCPVALSNQTSYRSFVQVTETGGETSSWAYTTFTVALDAPAPPIISAAQGTGPNGLPVAALTVNGTDNLLSEEDASFETGVGTWTGTTNCTVAQSTAETMDGTYSLAVTATAGADMEADSGDYAVTPGTEYTAMIAARAAATGRTVHAVISWTDASHTAISSSAGTTVSDTTTGWTQATVTATAPSNAAYAHVGAYIASPAASEVHYVDETGIRPGTGTTWYRGGLVGTVQIVVTRDDGLELRGASTPNPATMPASQVLDLSDAEMVPTVAHTWTAVGFVVLSSTATITSDPSAATSSVALTTSGWWEFDPTDLTTATNAQMTAYNPQITEQSTAHIVLGQTNPNIVASVMGGVDGTATFETFDSATYQGLSALLRSQKTVFISDPFGDNQGVTYVRFGPQTGGMSSGTGNKTKDAQLHPSTASAPHHEVSVTWVAQNRPVV